MSEIEIDDTTELLRRIFKYSEAFKLLGEKPPFFRLTPYEHRLFKEFLLKQFIPCNKYFGHIPTFHGVDFELVGRPLLFDGEHIRSDSGIKFEKEPPCTK